MSSHGEFIVQPIILYLLWWLVVYLAILLLVQPVGAACVCAAVCKSVRRASSTYLLRAFVLLYKKIWLALTSVCYCFNLGYACASSSTVMRNIGRWCRLWWIYNIYCTVFALCWIRLFHSVLLLLPGYVELKQSEFVHNSNTLNLGGSISSEGLAIKCTDRVMLCCCCLCWTSALIVQWVSVL